MAVHPPALVFCAWVLGLCHVGAAAETLSASDSSFCHGDLEVIYPELDIDKCLVIPKNFREKLSTAWDAPDIYFAAAQKDKRYTVVMVDPDAPSRTKPTAAYWRHWLVANIPGPALMEGLVQGTILTNYHPPTPPRRSGFHRYQFLLFEQRSDVLVSVTEQQLSSRGKWDLHGFIDRFDFGTPVAALQFLTQNYED